MGSSISKNISKVVTESIAKASSDVITSTTLTVDQSQVISVTDTTGDVVISGNTFTQKATVNMKSLLNALSNETIQQQITNDIVQACKSIVSGLNIFQFPNARNDINTFVRASTELVNTVSQECASSISQSQTINVSRTRGSVYVTNNVVSQMAKIFAECVEKAVNSNSVLQNLKQKVDQQAVAKADGLSLMQIILLVAIVLAVPMVAAIGGVTAVGKYVFPLSVVAGAGCLVAYNSWVDETVYSHAFSKLLRNYPNMCNSTVMTASTAYPTSESASKACAADKRCKAFDWMGIMTNPNPAGRPIVLDAPQTIFYSHVGDNCESEISGSTDSIPITRKPVFAKGAGPPTKLNADVYLDTLSTKYYFFDSTAKIWRLQGSFAHSDFTSRNSVDWGSVLPSNAVQAIAGSMYVYYDSNNPTRFRVYLKNPDGWKVYADGIKGPGVVADVPQNINVTGFTTVRRKDWLMYLGGSLTMIGLLGVVVSSKLNHHRPSQQQQ